MFEVMSWENETTPGWPVAYRIVPRYAWFPMRIDGRWRWRVRHYALQAISLEENPPAPWVTVRRALDPESLLTYAPHSGSHEGSHEGSH